jgi:hypothetical protein
MNRTLRFFVWKADDWRRKGVAFQAKSTSPEHLEGLKAYAERQAVLCQSLHDAFKHQWEGVPSLVKSARDEMDRPELFYQRKQKEFERKNKKVNQVFVSDSTPESSSTISIPLD